MLKIDYVAGFMDGEGSFCINLDKGKKNIKLNTAIFVGNYSLEVLNLLKEWFGTGKIIAVKTKEENIIYNLYIYNQNEISRICSLLIPYLIVKKDVAILLLKFVNSRLETRKKSKCHAKWQYSAYELNIFKEIKHINQRGNKENLLK